MGLQVNRDIDAAGEGSSQFQIHCKLGLTAATILFFELLLIRWVSTEVNIFAYLQNSILVVCFLGLGMGLMYPKSGARTIRTSVLCFSALALFLAFPLSREWAAFISVSLSFFHDFVIWDQSTHEIALKVKGAVVALGIAVLFAFAAVLWGVMVPLGQSLGGYFERSTRPIIAYSYDIGGSLIGIWMYTFLGYLSLPPFAWVLVGSLLLLPLTERKVWPLLGLVVLATWYGYRMERVDVFWTPYQKIEFSPASEEPGEYVVTTNNSGYQQIQNNAFELHSERLPELALSQYDIAARLHPDPKKILIAGAGTGNDLAGAIRRAPSAKVIGVEIDPILPSLGKRYHPEQPYDSAQLELIVDDARAAFHALPQGTFDLLITGLLDSHTTPNLSNARLDNFVYTRESLSAAAKLLNTDGVMVISFAPQREYIVERLRKTLDEIFQNPTRVFQVKPSRFGWGGVLFVNGSEETLRKVLEGNKDLAVFMSDSTHLPPPDPTVHPTTDDWPYLYIERPMIPTLFFVLAAIVPLLWAVTSNIFAGRLVLPPLHKREPLYYFALGVGFIVVQVFIITKASLLFGSTWIVNSVVISGMMMTILIANFLIQRDMRFPPRVVAALLVLVCIALASLSFEPLLSYSFQTRIIIGILLSGIPTLLSGILFGSAFAETKSPSEALGANLFGSLVGAILQSIVFLFGISSLSFLGAAAYTIALLTARRAQS